MRIGRAAAGSRMGTIGILMERAVWALSEAVRPISHFGASKLTIISKNLKFGAPDCEKTACF